jgi:hypothetical protein
VHYKELENFNYYQGNRLRQNETYRACSMHEREKFVQNCSHKNVKVGEFCEDGGINAVFNLLRILKR